MGDRRPRSSSTDNYYMFHWKIMIEFPIRKYNIYILTALSAESENMLFFAFSASWR